MYFVDFSLILNDLNLIHFGYLLRSLWDGNSPHPSQRAVCDLDSTNVGMMSLGNSIRSVQNCVRKCLYNSNNNNNNKYLKNNNGPTIIKYSWTKKIVYAGEDSI